MTMPMTPEVRQQRIVRALTSVKAARNARRIFDLLEDGNRQKTTENDGLTREFLEDTIRRAMGYGYPVEAVADAADMTIDEITAIVGDAAAV